MNLFEYDQSLGIDPAFLCGVDEAGRGPLAGDVYAAAVIFPPDCRIEGLDDSKKLSPKKRDALYKEIREKALAYSVASASVAEIEELNILNAAFLAMERAVEGLPRMPKLVLVDGNRNPSLPVHSLCIVKGDGTSACIAAASILAKVERDRHMEQMAGLYPQYQFDKHKGYGTALHYQMLDQYGPSPIHRPSFLKKYTQGEESPAAKRGRIGEEAACAHLVQEGWRIRSRNWACLYGELDVVAEKDGLLAFVEVKARKEGARVSGREAVGLSKQKKLVQAAALYLQQVPSGYTARFDVCEVTLSGGKNPAVCRLEYWPAAFEGGVADACDRSAL